MVTPSGDRLCVVYIASQRKRRSRNATAKRLDIHVKIHAQIISPGLLSLLTERIARFEAYSMLSRPDGWRFAKTDSRRFPFVFAEAHRRRETAPDRQPLIGSKRRRRSRGTTARYFLKLCDKRLVLRRSAMWVYVILLRCCK